MTDEGWTVWQRGLPVAWASEWDEAKWFLAIYAQKGSCELREGRKEDGRLRVRYIEHD